MLVVIWSGDGTLLDSQDTSYTVETRRALRAVGWSNPSRSKANRRSAKGYRFFAGSPTRAAGMPFLPPQLMVLRPPGGLFILVTTIQFTQKVVGCDHVTGCRYASRLAIQPRSTEGMFFALSYVSASALVVVHCEGCPNDMIFFFFDYSFTGAQ